MIKKYNFGISSYFLDIDYKYLKEAKSLGAKYLFTSFHIPEEDDEQLIKELPNFLKIVNELEYILVPDISPLTFKKLGLSNKDFKGLKNLNIKALRLDFGIDNLELIKEIENDFEIIFNASVISESYLDDIFKHQFDLNKIKFMHNFYPKTDTGISNESFKKINQKFLNRKLDIFSFVPGDLLKRYPFYEGLPTLESHRNINPYIGALDLFKNYNINTVLIGDSKADLITLKLINEYIENGIINIPAIFYKEYEYLYDKTIFTRKDISDKIIRLNTERTTNIAPLRNNHRNKGDITIENNLAGRYCGEVNIHILNNVGNSRSNNIGYIHPDYIEIVKLVGNDKIKFIRI